MKKIILAASLFSSLFADAGLEQTVEIPRYDNRINFSLIRAGYERLKPQGVYIAIQEWYTPFAHDNPKWINILEARLGYNFFFEGKDRLTPMIGGGFYKYYSTKKPSAYYEYYYGNPYKQGIGYVMTGATYEHDFNRLFSMGLTMKLSLGTVANERSTWGNPIFGYQVEAPFTFRFARGRKWDYRFAPFAVSQMGRNFSASDYGIYGEFGYRF
jgi:hypothetical protein